MSRWHFDGDDANMKPWTVVMCSHCQGPTDMYYGDVGDNDVYCGHSCQEKADAEAEDD